MRARSAVSEEALRGPVRSAPRSRSSRVSALWPALVRVQREVESTAWGRVLLSNVWPAYVFALSLVVKIVELARMLARGPGATPGLDEQRYLALAAEQSTSILFLALVVVLFVVRRPVVGRRSRWLGGVVALAGTFILTAVAFVPPLGSAPTGVLVVASAITALGTIFTAWSLFTLGRCFGLFPEVRGFVRRGPYRWVRHPVYLGEMVSALGLLLAKPHPAIVALYVAFVGLQYWRTRLEESALVEAFPSEYPAYQASTGRLVPWWR